MASQLRSRLNSAHELAPDGTTITRLVLPRQWISSAWGYGGSGPGLDDGMSFRVGVVQGLALIWALISAISAPRRLDHRSTQIKGWLIVAAVALLMMTASSGIVWERLPPLAFVQFP